MRHDRTLKILIQGLGRSSKGTTGLMILAAITLIPLAAPLLLPQDPFSIGYGRRPLAPVFAGGVGAYALGTDHLGRDLLGRVMLGTRTSVLDALICVSCGLAAGSFMGAVAGHFGGWVDNLIIRFVDYQLSFPFILLAIMILAVFGTGFRSMTGALTPAIWVNYAWLMRSETLKLRELEFVQAARAIGVRDLTIIATHVFPNVVPSLTVMAKLDLAWIIIAESALSSLGLGIQPPTPSLGFMVAKVRNYLFEAVWETLIPALTIFAFTVAIILFGDFLWDSLDPAHKHT